MKVKFTAVVTEIQQFATNSAGGQVWRLALDRTGFSAGDRGELEAVAPSGARLRICVLAVEPDEAGEVWHLVEKPLSVGTEITATVAGRD